jgi:hypothetical protein
MAKLVFGMMQSLDGYVDHLELGPPGPAGVRHFIEHVRDLDEYRLYLRPIVLGRGKPFFARARPPLRLVATDLVGEDMVRLRYVPA